MGIFDRTERSILTSPLSPSGGGGGGGILWSTPVDAHIIPASGSTYDLGTTTTRFRSGYFEEAVGIWTGGVNTLGFQRAGTTPSGIALVASIFQTGSAAGNVGFYTGDIGAATGALYLETGNSSTAAAANTGLQYIKTGNLQSVAATGITGAISLITGNNAGTSATGSGSILLQTGSVASGTRGNIQLAADSIILGATGSTTVSPANGGSMGSSTAPWLGVMSNIWGIGAAAIQWELNGGSIATPSSGSVFGTLKSNAGTGFTIFSVSQAGNTGPLSMETGNSSGFASGSIKIQTGTAASTSVSGNISLLTGASASGKSGDVTIKSGTPSGNVQSGNMFFESGSGGYASGEANVKTGNCIGSGVASGALKLFSGNSSLGQSGAVLIKTGATNPAGGSVAGNIELETGVGTPGGKIILKTGNSVITGSNGPDIEFFTGTAQVNANGGNLKFTTGSGAGTGHAGDATFAATRTMVISLLGADPTGGLLAGMFYYNTVSNKLKMYNGATWETVTSV